ncbi:hypothetical protein NX794_04120 [Streptomyces sp. LP11]|uniref:Integral membrane protein n=1 Tax=Streptomyces pyxinicus TaxID=2970331 RepID=A0ABT2AX03_9ACTN|nr:hypothetical protein [Streptomyces sp. LP11]MCS0600420.1 hypothetical protein [Streptomyces sp. LP11]
MGIESDQVVYEYLSRVGDIAQQRQLPSGTRMRLVSELRNEIDRQRSRTTVDSPDAVRRILDHLGSPDDVVEAAGGRGTAGSGGLVAPSTSVPAQPEPPTRERPARERPAPERPKGLRRVVPRPRPPATPAPPEPTAPPHLAAAHELGDSVASPDWWRLGGSGTLPLGEIDQVPGFVGGVEIPELLRRPPREVAEKEEKPTEAEPVAVPRRGLFRRGSAAAAEGAVASRRLLPAPAAGWSNPLLLLAAAALVVGAVLGNWFALLLGWAIAYGSRRLTPAETKWAVMVLPGAAVAGGLLWLWGRDTGRWGAPITHGHMSAALTETWPWVVRAAAVTSAAYLAWRSQRAR